MSVTILLRLVTLLAGAFLGTPAGVLAQPVRATLPNGLRVHADYQRGQPGRAAVVIIHGFLQTQNFPTVRRLADALHEEEGYTVLTPTLSLGISDRRQSLACEAIQHHTMESSAAELLFWVRWLVARGHRRIALIGHSTGSLMVLAALPGAPPAVRQAILISLTYIGQHLDVFERRRHAEDVRRARERLARDPDRIDSYHIAYCKAYAARPGDVLSYYAWDQAHTLQALRKARVPATVILGSADRRIDPDWRKAIAATGTRMLVIEGANHFFDDAHEFDLLDAVSAVLAGGSGEAAP